MSKQDILKRIRENKPAQIDLPDIPDFTSGREDGSALFRANAEANAARVLFRESIVDPKSWITENFPGASQILSTLPDWPNQGLNQRAQPADWQDLEVAIITSELGVAENGAVWISNMQLPERVIPFITQHLVVVLSRKAIVPNMHVAYRQIPIENTGFGVFIGGPSKTGDIEQSLVIGAQGARTHTIILDK